MEAIFGGGVGTCNLDASNNRLICIFFYILFP